MKDFLRASLLIFLSFLSSCIGANEMAELTSGFETVEQGAMTPREITNANTQLLDKLQSIAFSNADNSYPDSAMSEATLATIVIDDHESAFANNGYGIEVESFWTFVANESEKQVVVDWNSTTNSGEVCATASTTWGGTGNPSFVRIISRITRKDATTFRFLTEMQWGNANNEAGLPIFTLSDLTAASTDTTFEILFKCAADLEDDVVLKDYKCVR